MYDDLEKPQHGDVPFATIWKIKAPPRVNLFIWKVAHDRLMTNVERTRRGMTGSDLCPRCSQAPETIMHVLRDCEFALTIWEKLVHPEVWHKFASLGHSKWLEYNLKSLDIGIGSWHWATVFGSLIHMLWVERNYLVFAGKSITPEQLLPKLFGQVDVIHSLLLTPALTFQEESRREVMVAWEPPPPGSLKLNANGSHDHDHGSLA